jgi:hypothetical protein
LAGFRSRQPWHMRAVLRMAGFGGARSKICFRPEQSAAGGGGGGRRGRREVDGRRQQEEEAALGVVITRERVSGGRVRA